jgi:sentrin-specific protease 2 (axin associating molecule)
MKSQMDSIPGPSGVNAAQVSRSLGFLTDSDIERVSRPEEMINDEAINSYLSLLTIHFEAEKAVYLRTQFWTSYARHGYDHIKKWLPKSWTPTHTPGILLIPIHQNLHWFLISVDFARREITLYDSMTVRSQIASKAFKVMTIDNI